MIYHYITGEEEISYFIKYSDNIMIYHYITGEEEILTSLNILIISCPWYYEEEEVKPWSQGWLIAAGAYPASPS